MIYCTIISFKNFTIVCDPIYPMKFMYNIWDDYNRNRLPTSHISGDKLLKRILKSLKVKLLCVWKKKTRNTIAGVLCK